MYTFSLKIKWGYISASNLETERALLLPVSISLKQSLVLCGLPVANYKKNYERSKKLPTPTRSNVANWIS